ncbi:MAG: M61 family metallopeptidase [Candidatus Brocadiae bacterium]|nr:M61 family metallopeptidase [Candidatus Brocadiia bacterium]
MIEYRIVVSDPHKHLVDVTLEADVEGPVDLVLPAWIPGSYKIRDFAQHIQEFHAVGPWEKLDKNTWRVRCPSGRLRAGWRAYCHELTVRTSHVDDEHAHINPANILMFIDGRKDEPCRLQVRAPRGWKVACSLDPDGPGRFRAPDYDVLIDAPVECGEFEEFSFKVRGKTHRFLWHGDSNLDVARLRKELPKIVQAECALMKVVPYERYIFFTHFTDDGKGGGLEHLNSTSLAFPRFGFRPNDRHERFLSLCAHEFFHLWNVKRIRPQALGPFEYGKENYTRLLWAMEGVTSYYDEHVLLRAGLLKAGGYLKKLGEKIERFLETPGRRVQSLAESSFDAWIKYYNPGEHSPNATISYYEKGLLVSMLLDLEIRRRSRGRRSLDNVLRQLWREYAAKGIGFPEGRYEKICEEVAGASLRGFFDKYVRGTDELSFDRYLGAAGLRLAQKEPKDGEPGRKPWCGLRTERKDGKTMVASVLADSPAHAAGINAGDELLALAGHRVDHETFEKRLEERRIGETVDLAVFRGSRLKRYRMKVGARRTGGVRIARVPAPTAEQKAVYRSWMGEAWDAGTSESRG